MPRDLEHRTLEILELALRRRVHRGPTPDWLIRPGRNEIRARWRLIRGLYRNLSDGLELPNEMPLRERRAIDGIIGGRGLPWRIVEIDEAQHFTPFRAMTLSAYPNQERLAFPRKAWHDESRRGRTTSGGGWAAPKPPLFPMAGGRHRQRAFRDALADLLPAVHGWEPTLRIAHFEVEPWIWSQHGASARLQRLIEERLAGAPDNNSW